jgi:hypothetical protein
MKKLNLILVALALCLMPVLDTGCKGTLAPNGAYKDKTLYNADVLLATSYYVVHSFVTYEQQNREALKAMPQIKIAADSIRQRAPSAFASAFAIRDKYEVSASSADATALQTALDVIRAMAVEATKQMATQIK